MKLVYFYQSTERGNKKSLALYLQLSLSSIASIRSHSEGCHNCSHQVRHIVYSVSLTRLLRIIWRWSGNNVKCTVSDFGQIKKLNRNWIEPIKTTIRVVASQKEFFTEATSEKKHSLYKLRCSTRISILDLSRYFTRVNYDNFSLWWYRWRNVDVMFDPLIVLKVGVWWKYLWIFLESLRESSVIFSNLRTISENFRKRSCCLWTTFGGSWEIFGKW